MTAAASTGALDIASDIQRRLPTAKINDAHLEVSNDVDSNAEAETLEQDETVHELSLSLRERRILHAWIGALKQEIRMRQKQTVRLEREKNALRQEKSRPAPSSLAQEHALLVTQAQGLREQNRLLQARIGRLEEEGAREVERLQGQVAEEYARRIAFCDTLMENYLAATLACARMAEDHIQVADDMVRLEEEKDYWRASFEWAIGEHAGPAGVGHPVMA